VKYVLILDAPFSSLIFTGNFFASNYRVCQPGSWPTAGAAVSAASEHGKPAEIA